MNRSKYWIVLSLSAVFEAVWASALAESEGFTKPIPIIVFFIATAISMAGLAYAMTALPVSVAYAVWTGIGATGTVIYATVVGREVLTVWKVLFLIGIIGCVIGLRAIDSGEEEVTD